MLSTCLFVQVKDVLFEPVRKTQDAMHFKRVSTPEGDMWMPCGPREPGAKQTTMTDLAGQGLAAMVNYLFLGCTLESYILLYTTRPVGLSFS